MNESVLKLLMSLPFIPVGILVFFIAKKMYQQPEKFTHLFFKMDGKSGKATLFTPQAVKFGSYCMFFVGIVIILFGLFGSFIL